METLPETLRNPGLLTAHYGVPRTNHKSTAWEQLALRPTKNTTAVNGVPAFGATGKNRTCDAAFGGPHDIHFTTVAVMRHSSADPWRASRRGVP